MNEFTSNPCGHGVIVGATSAPDEAGVVELGTVTVEGSIYEGMAACLSRHGRTIAHVLDYQDALEIAAALSPPPVVEEAGLGFDAAVAAIEAWAAGFTGPSDTAKGLRLTAKDLRRNRETILAGIVPTPPAGEEAVELEARIREALPDSLSNWAARDTTERLAEVFRRYHQAPLIRSPAMSDDLRKALEERVRNAIGGDYREPPGALDIARACATVANEIYGDFDAATWAHFKANGIWNDHAAVQSALVALRLASNPASSPPLITEEMVERGVVAACDDILARDVADKVRTPPFAEVDVETQLFWQHIARACLTAGLASPEEGRGQTRSSCGRPIYGPCGCDGFSIGHSPDCDRKIVGYTSGDRP